MNLNLFLIIVISIGLIPCLNYLINYKLLTFVEKAAKENKTVQTKTLLIIPVLTYGLIYMLTIYGILAQLYPGIVTRFTYIPIYVAAIMTIWYFLFDMRLSGILISAYEIFIGLCIEDSGPVKILTGIFLIMYLLSILIPFILDGYIFLLSWNHKKVIDQAKKDYGIKENPDYSEENLLDPDL